MRSKPVVHIQTLDEVIGESIAHQRFAMRLLTAFAALALLFAGVGIYGVLSYTVRQRVQAIGIRMAPGAAGPAVGLAGAAAFGSVLNTLVFGVTPRDAATFASIRCLVLNSEFLISARRDTPSVWSVSRRSSRRRGWRRGAQASSSCSMGACR